MCPSALNNLINPSFLIKAFCRMNSIIPQRWDRPVYLFLLSAIAVFLPLSFFFLSVSTLLLVIYWLVSGNWQNKIRRIRNHTSLLFFLSIYLLPLLGLWNTSDFQWAMHDLRIKLPMLALPLIIASLPLLQKKETKILFLAYISSLALVSLLGILAKAGWLKVEIRQARDLSLFISYIRLSLMIDLAIAGAWVFLLDRSWRLSRRESVFLILVSGGLLVFNVMLMSFSGMLLLLVSLLFIVLRYHRQITSSLIKGGLVLAGAGMLVLISVLFLREYRKFFRVSPLSSLELQAFTEEGNAYTHYRDNAFLENGEYIWIYISYPELESAWEQRSELAFTGRDQMGHALQNTLIRYLTSKGLRKDRQGVNALTDQDIRNIESGIANTYPLEVNPLSARIYTILWQIDRYRKGGNPGGHSITQRFEYWKTAWHIIREHPFTGVGTGDVKAAFAEQYERDGSLLQNEFRLRAHNQYLTFWLTYGIGGLLWFLLAFFFPLFRDRRRLPVLYVLFLIITAVSMLNEDMLETHTAVSFVGYFAGVLYYGYQKEEV